jgi:hypothetical protein
MEGLRAVPITVTTDASGDGTATSSSMFGWIYAIELIDGSFENGVDWTFACATPNDSGVARNLFVIADANDDKMYYPRTLEHLATDGTVLTTHCHPLVNGGVKLTIAQGGNAKTGGAIIYYFR